VIGARDHAQRSAELTSKPDEGEQPAGDDPASPPSSADSWRKERFGPRGADGKGRYWQWRRGAGKNRQSIYGGKINE
jgi:hypothetical protein